MGNGNSKPDWREQTGIGISEQACNGPKCMPMARIDAFSKTVSLKCFYYRSLGMKEKTR